MADFSKKLTMPSAQEAIPDRSQVISVSPQHVVTGNRIIAPFPENMQQALFGMGCFWGAERCFWQMPGIFSTAVGYAGGFTANATYEDVCSGMSGHNEVVLVIYDPKVVSYQQLLIIFWQAHNPTQGMRQGNDRGSQYRSGIYCYNSEQYQLAEKTKIQYQKVLTEAGYGQITTEIIDVPEFYYAEDYHQQYLAKNPRGYCGLGGVGVLFAD